MGYMNIQSSFIKQFDNWEKKGILIKPNFKKRWMKSHAAVPFAKKISENNFQIFFCIRDNKNRSHIVSKKINLKKKNNTKINSKIELYPGKLGEFDENGVTPTWVLDLKQNKYLYYVGWRPTGTVRFSLFVGLAIKKKKSKKYKKVGNFPILERSKVDPFLTATLSILKEKKKFRMWYVSGEGWVKLKNKETIPRYNIKYAESDDGIKWERKGKVCIDFKSRSESAIARPSVIKIKNIYYMWYCFKAINKDYKIGFAISKDGKNWKRFDKFCSSLNYKKKIWENKMLAYPHVIKNKNELLMFYNGNGYGKTGIALAKLNISFLNKSSKKG